MKYWKTALIFLVSIILQPTLLNFLTVLKSTPNLILAFVIVFAFLYQDYVHSLIFGTVAGVIYDMLYSLSIGQTALSLVIVSVIILMVRDSMNVENIINMLMVSISSIFIYYSCNWIFLRILGENLGYLYMLKNSLVAGAYTLLVIAVIYVYLVNMSRRKRRSKYFK